MNHLWIGWFIEFSVLYVCVALICFVWMRACIILGSVWILCKSDLSFNVVGVISKGALI